ncbi:reverse transcriptase domain-containing protein [Tanacetum coccineum]
MLRSCYRQSIEAVWASHYGSNHNFNNCPLTRNEFPVFHDNIHQFQQTAAVGNFVKRNPPNLANQMRPLGFNQPNVQRLPGNPKPIARKQFQFESKPWKQFQSKPSKQSRSSFSTINQSTTSLPSSTISSSYASNSRSGKTLEGPLTPLVPTPVVFIPSKEPEQNSETSTEKVQNPNLEDTAHVPPPKEEDSIFMEIPKPKAKKTVNVEIQDLNSPRPNSYQSNVHTRREDEKIGLKDALVEMPKFNKWLSSLLRNKEKLEEIAITTVNVECSAIIMNKVPEKLEDPRKFLIPRIAEDVVVRVDGFTFLTDFVVVNFELDPRVPIILGRPFLRTAKALIDLYEETLTLRVGNEELVYYADKTEKNKDKNFVHTISVIDFSKADPFSGSTTNTLPPSSSPVKISDNFEKFADELAPLDSLPPGNDDSTLKKDLHKENFQVYSNPLFEFDDNFKSSNVNPLFEENDKNVEIKSSSSFTLTSPEESEFEAYLERDSIPPGIDLTLPPTLEVSSSNPTSPTLTGEKVCSWKTMMLFSLVRFVWRMMTRIAIRKKIICLLATFLNKKPKPLSRPQAAQEEIKIEEDKVSSDVPINTIVMPIRITFDNPIDFNHLSKPKDFKRDLTVALDSTKSSIFPPPLLDSDSPFTAELSASITLNSLRNEDKVFKSGILVYHAIHDKNLVTLEENLKEHISSRTLLVFKEPSFLLPSPEPPDECLNFEPILVMKNVVLNEDFYQSKKTLPLNVEDVNSFAFVIWTFLPYFTYPEDSPLFLSFWSEDFIFDPGITTFHFSYLKPVACSMKAFHLLSLRTN